MSSVQGSKNRNDDYAIISEKAPFCAIADGIGGARDGDYMSRVGCGAGACEYERSGDLAAAFRYANEAAIQTAEWLSNPACGASLLLAETKENEMRFVGAGDVAAFLLRNGHLERITPLGRNRGERRLASAVGYIHDCASYERACAIEPGDKVLICTDGVWETYFTFDAGLLVEYLGQEATPSSLAARIVSGAKRLGTLDDATAIVIQVDGNLTQKPSQGRLNTQGC